MAVTAEIELGFPLQCRGPQPKNPNARGIEVQIGLSISVQTRTRAITCTYLVVDENGILRCNLLNRLGIPYQTVKAILATIEKPPDVQRDAKKLPATILEHIRTNVVPTTLDQSTLPVCRIADLVTI